MRSTLSCSVVRADVAAGGEVGAAVGTLGFWVEISVSGGWDVDGATSDSLVVFSDMAESLVVVVGTAVVTVAVVGVGAGTGAVVVVRRDTAEVVSVCSVVLAVVTTSADVVMVVDGAPGTTPGVLDVTVGGLRVVDVMVTAGGLVAMVTLAVTGLMVDH